MPNTNIACKKLLEVIDIIPEKICIIQLVRVWKIILIEIFLLALYILLLLLLLLLVCEDFWET